MLRVEFCGGMGMGMGMGMGILGTQHLRSILDDVMSQDGVSVSRCTLANHQGFLSASKLVSKVDTSTAVWQPLLYFRPCSNAISSALNPGLFLFSEKRYGIINHENNVLLKP